MKPKNPALEVLFWIGLVMMLGSMVGALFVLNSANFEIGPWITLGAIFTIGAVIVSARLH